MEAESLSQSLVLIRELLSSVNQQVQELELTHKLQEIRSRLDPRTETEVRGGGAFRGAELLRRRLIHEGTLLLKTSQASRLKGNVCWGVGGGCLRSFGFQMFLSDGGPSVCVGRRAGPADDRHPGGVTGKRSEIFFPLSGESGENDAA